MMPAADAASQAEVKLSLVPEAAIPPGHSESKPSTPKARCANRSLREPIRVGPSPTPMSPKTILITKEGEDEPDRLVDCRACDAEQ